MDPLRMLCQCLHYMLYRIRFKGVSVCHQRTVMESGNHACNAVLDKLPSREGLIHLSDSFLNIYYYFLSYYHFLFYAHAHMKEVLFILLLTLLNLSLLVLRIKMTWSTVFWLEGNTSLLFRFYNTVYVMILLLQNLSS